MAVRTVALVLTLLFASSASAQPKGDATDFAHDVLPVLKARCAKCHTNGTYKGGLSFDTREALLKSKAVVPGKSAASELVKRITSTDPDERMPPKSEPLPAKEVAARRQKRLADRRFLTDFRLSLDAAVLALRGRDKVIVDAENLPGKRHLLLMDPDVPRPPAVVLPKGQPADQREP